MDDDDNHFYREISAHKLLESAALGAIESALEAGASKQSQTDSVFLLKSLINSNFVHGNADFFSEKTPFYNFLPKICRNFSKENFPKKVSAKTAAKPSTEAPPNTLVSAADLYKKSDNNSKPQKQKKKDDSENSQFDESMISNIVSEILENNNKITFSDIAGLKTVKRIIEESVIWPLLKPSLFVGLRSPPKAILLFGPPGTGKSLIGKAIASSVSATFFSISAATLLSKWHGESEKMVKCLYHVARQKAPSVIFVDEIDSLLMARSSNEDESNRRLKTEFLVQIDGVSGGDKRILTIGATNRPEELDDAAIRRFTRRLYVPLPDFEARESLIRNLLGKIDNNLTDTEIQQICDKTEGYSGADLQALCEDAAMAPLRKITGNFEKIEEENLEKVNYEDFLDSLSVVKKSINENVIEFYEKWAQEKGVGRK